MDPGARRLARHCGNLESGLFARQKPAVENKTGNNRFFHACNPPRRLPRQHEQLRETVEKMKRRGPAVCEAGCIDRACRNVHETGSEAARTVFLAAPPGAAKLVIFADEFMRAQPSVRHHVIHIHRHLPIARRVAMPPRQPHVWQSWSMRFHRDLAITGAREPAFGAGATGRPAAPLHRVRPSPAPYISLIRAARWCACGPRPDRRRAAAVEVAHRRVRVRSLHSHHHHHGPGSRRR